MTTRNSNNARWTDEEIESLLVSFYQQETPRELPPLRQPVATSSTIESRRVTVVPQRETNPRGAGYAGLAVVACMLLLFMAVLSPVQNANPVAPKADDGSVSDHIIVPSAPVVAKKPTNQNVPVIVADPDFPLRLPETTPLPPELIPRWQLPEMHVGETSGTTEPPRTDWLNRLDIRVFPLPDERNTPDPSPRRLPEQQ